MAIKLWCDFYRPQTLDDYVWVDPIMRATVEQWLADGALPHCLFSGVSGTGKTSLAKLVFKQLNIPSIDLLYINASRERQIDAFQAKVIGFIESWSMGESGIKYVLLDEADKMSQMTQGLLRNEMETYSDGCRFIMTANYPQKIIPAIHGRVQELRFPSLNKEDFSMRLVQVLDAEQVDFDLQTVLAYVEATHPDLRKCLNLAQQNTHGGKLQPLCTNEGAPKDYLLAMLDLFRQGKFLEARKLIVSQIQPEEYDDLYRTLYQNLDLFGSTQKQQDNALLAIRRGLVHQAVVADPEINAAAVLVELAQISQS